MSDRILIVAFIAVFSMAMFFVYTDAAEAEFATDGLVSYWTFDGGKYEDVVGGHNGEVGEGEVVSVPGKFGDALEFDGSGAFVIMADPEAFICNKDFTWIAWVNSDGGGGCIVSKTDGVLDSDVKGAKTFMIDGGPLGMNVGWVDGLSGTTPVNDGDWHQVAMVIEGQTVLFYVDGEEDFQGTLAVATHPEAGFAITIGWDPRCGMEFPPMNGIIDDVAIYSRALDKDELAQNFKAGVLDLAVEPAHKLAGAWGAVKISN